jgi:cytidylate kinase
MHVPRHIDAIVEEQVRRWELQRQARSSEARVSVEPWPLITVSREFGSRGALLGERVARRLGFGFWDQELVHEVAQRTGLREALVASLDEHVRSRVDDLVSSIFTGPDATAAEYVRHVGRVVHTLEQHGSAVIIGRGAQFIVRADRALRVRVVGPLEDRARGYAQREHIDPARARSRVEEVERDRRAFYRRHFDRDVTDPGHYDLMVNTGTLSIDAAVEIIVAAYKAKLGRLPEPARAAAMA